VRGVPFFPLRLAITAAREELAPGSGLACALKKASFRLRGAREALVGFARIALSRVSRTTDGKEPGKDRRASINGR
jgi:hypothetical protein